VTGNRPGRNLPGAPKSNLQGFTKKPLIFEHDIAVGHPGQVITHGAVQAGLADAAARAFAIPLDAPDNI